MSPAGESYSSSEGSESGGRNYSDQEGSGHRDNTEGRGTLQSRPYGGGGFSSFGGRGDEADSSGGGEGDFRSMQGQQQRGSWISKDGAWAMAGVANRERVAAKAELATDASVSGRTTAMEEGGRKASAKESLLPRCAVKALKDIRVRTTG